MRSAPVGRRIRLDAYKTAVMTGPIARDLKRVRNVKPLWSKFGTKIGVPLGGVDMWLNTLISGVGLGFTLKHGKADHATLEKAQRVEADRLPEAGWHSDLRSADQRVVLRHQSRGGPAGPPEACRSARAGGGQPAGVRRAGAALLPGRRLRDPEG